MKPAVLAVRLTPRGGRDAIDGWAADADGRPYLKARVSAPPVEGEANAALVALLAKRLGLSRSAVRVTSGATARLKRLEIEGLSPEDLDRLLGRS
ncbi:hypothetical protein CFHF_16745 [Caulobacter flavus]|uniref:UPF0235 protein C1707_04445 n=1 Tax=Caulobacter flavus TaxID=1679497 RepID=A0A2N5CQW2_9CAUL|nr:DUF167 family protein [Caulobacter flavus]AYV45560.1 hypothetical protein C1707_04445 [Caulobacter flavus]PLR10600.1 hypothetical protein CFHF_16745 [Caulobacter flavus]